MEENGTEIEVVEPARISTNSGQDWNNAEIISKIKDLVDDDTCAQLRRHFLRNGKGRPPDLPPSPILTNAILLKLLILKEESNASFKLLKSWLAKIHPETVPVSESRVTDRIRKIARTASTIPPSESGEFLAEHINFNRLVPSLDSLRINRLHLTGEVGFNGVPGIVTNDVVIALEHMRVKLGECGTFNFKWIRQLCENSLLLTDYKVKKSIKDVLATYKKLIKNEKDKDKLSLFCRQVFLSASSTTTTTIIEPPECSNCLVKDEFIHHQNTELRDTNKLVTKLDDSLTLTKNSLTVMKTNSVDMSTELNALKACLTETKATNKILKSDNRKLNNELDIVCKSNLYKNNAENKKRITVLESDNAVLTAKSLQLSNDVVDLKKSVKKEQTLKSNVKQKLTEKHAKISDMQQMLQYDKDSNPPLELKVKGSSHRYNNKIRKTYYALFKDKVSISTASQVVSTVARNLFDTEITASDLPSKTTAINFSNEANVLAQHHLFDEISQADHFIFACDGTSRQKSQYLEQHIILSNGKQLSLGYSMVASETSDTLLEKCIESLRNICTVHSLINDAADEEDLLKDIIRKLKGMMSDRADVMKCFDKKVLEFKNSILKDEDCSLHFLFCNAHFLLKLSSATEKAMVGEEERVMEEVGESSLGRDCVSGFSSFSNVQESAVVRTIRMTSECVGPRGDEKNGGRSEWLAFCSLKNVKSKFTTYRSNRFNNLFHNATALIYHRSHVISFLSDYASNTNRKLLSVSSDVSDDNIMSLVAVLSFFHVYFTEPYWQLMNSKKTYYDFPMYVSKMKETLSCWCVDDFDVNLVTSVFEDFLPIEDDALTIKNFFTCDSFNPSIFKPVLQNLAKEFCKALEMQLSDFLDGGVFSGQLSEDVKKVLKSCPLTNLTGERLFGDLDFDMYRRRNASLHVRSTTSMWQHNHTDVWLNSLDASKLQKLLESAIKNGPEWRQRHRDEIRRVRDEIKQKIAENKNEKEQRVIKIRERKLAAVEALVNEGIPLVKTKEELDVIYNGPKSTERMKDQIRFRSLVQGEKITLTGTKDVIYKRLLDHIESSSSSL